MDSDRRLPLTFGELVELLVERGLISSAEAADLIGVEPRRRAALGDAGGDSALHPIEVLASFKLDGRDKKPLTEDRLTELFSESVGRPYVKLDPLKLDARFMTSLISRPFARKHSLLPLEERDGRLVVVTIEPFDRVALESVESAAGMPVDVCITSKTDIQNLINQFFGFQKSVDSAQRDLTESIDLGNLEQFVRLRSEKEIEASDQHVVNAVQYLFTYAFAQRASDIHIEPKREKSVVRFRIDGVLHPVSELPAIVHRAVVNRIKTLARLDIGEKRRPQDGRIKTEHDGKAVEFRISTMPVAFGEKIVLRIFDPDIVHDDLARIGFFPRELELFDKLIRRPHGIVLVTGPTGSGKTTTLYTALRKLATDDVNITTIEDPIEMIFERVNQTAVQPGVGITFASALRTILRQDPDVVMVGEIRDLETAQNAIQAALTGHLVFSTLHTNDAPSAVTRLMDLGVQPFLLASTLTGVLAQRLVRKVCDGCANERVLRDDERRSLGVLLPDAEVRVRFGEGCVECRHSGYRGRSAVCEMFEVNDAIKRLVMDSANAGVIKTQAQADGMVTLRESAVQKLLQGVTTPEEVLRVTALD